METSFNCQTALLISPPIHNVGLESWTGEKAEAFGKSVCSAARGPLSRPGKQGPERRLLSAGRAGTAHRTAPAHPHSAPGGGTCSGAPGARLPGDASASAGDTQRLGAVTAWPPPLTRQPGRAGLSFSATPVPAQKRPQGAGLLSGQWVRAAASLASWLKGACRAAALGHEAAGRHGITCTPSTPFPFQAACLPAPG